MKILLISANVAKTPYPVFPLGIAMVAAALKNAGHQVNHFDFLQHELSLDAVARAVRDDSPDLVGISLRNIDNVNLLNEQRYIGVVGDIARTIRGETQARIVLGGSAFSIMPEAILATVGADYGIIGEGELAMVEFVRRAAAGDYPEKRCIAAEDLMDGKDIPSAFYDADIMKFYLQSGTVASLQTKRGCSHHCVYCSYPDLEGSSIRPRDPAAVADDVEALAGQHGAKYIFFTDSVFNDDAGHFRDVIREFSNRGLSIPWTAFFKPGGLDDDIVASMKSTGLMAAEIGSDASSDTTLRGLGKNFLFDEVVACNDLFIRHEVAAAHFFMFGGPGETRDTVAEGLKNLARLEKAVLFAFMGIRILPNTPLAAMAEREGIIQPGQDLLDPVYYLSPDLDKAWLEQALTDGFAKHRNWIFPPDALDSTLAFLHKMGYSGSLWEMLGKKEGRRRRRGGKLTHE